MCCRLLFLLPPNKRFENFSNDKIKHLQICRCFLFFVFVLFQIIGKCKIVEFVVGIL